MDADDDALVWSIRGKPAGASFSVSTGVLSWTPTAPGAAANIVITVSDGARFFTVTSTHAGLSVQQAFDDVRNDR